MKNTHFVQESLLLENKFISSSQVLNKNRNDFKMNDKIILKTNLWEIKKLQVNIKFYQALGVDWILLGAFDRLNEGEIKEILALNETYQKAGIGLILSFDISNLMGKLLGTNPSEIDFADPKIRKGLYHFLAFLIKHGIRGFDLRGIEKLVNKGNNLLEALRELNKNTFFNKEILSMAEIAAPKKTLLALGNPNLSTLSLIRPKGEVGDLFGLASDFVRANSGLCLCFDNFDQSDINFYNYPLSAKRLIYMTLFFLKGSLYIEEDDLDIEDVKFLRELFTHKDEAKKLVKTQTILPKEKDILAFIRYGEGKKVLFLANLSEKEVLLDLAFKVMDYKDYKYLAGSITRRTLYRTTLLRPYEAVAFINCK